MGRERISSVEVLINPVRIRILKAVRKKQGSISELEKILKINRGTLKHHLIILERAGYIKRTRIKESKGKPSVISLSPNLLKSKNFNLQSFIVSTILEGTQIKGAVAREEHIK